MNKFRRSIPWMDDDAAGFGDSYGTHETQVIPGNSFDYPAIHGKAMLQAGYSFVSCSDEAVERGTVRLNNYPSVHLILGKECQTKMGRGGVKPLEFKTFTPELQKAIRSYCAQGGNLFASGAFIATDLWDNPLAPSLEEDRKFATDVLKYQWRVGQAALLGKVRTISFAVVSCWQRTFLLQRAERSIVCGGSTGCHCPGLQRSLYSDALC